MKKVFSVLLALVMAFSMLSMLSYAAPQNAVLEISIEPTQQNYSKGDIVKFEVFYTSSSELGLMGCPFSFSVGFDNRVFETIEDVSDKGNYEQHTQTVLTTGYPVDNNIVKSLSWSYVYGEEKLTDADKAKGWNSVFFTSMTPTNGCDDDYSTKTASFAFQLRVKADAPDNGCYKLGITDYSIQNSETEINEEVGSVAGPSGTDYGFSVEKIFETIDATVTVPTVVAESILKPMSSQIRFKGVGSDGDFTNYGGTFDVRTRATISTADFNAKFTDEATAKAGISEFGFIYKAASVGAFDLATAKGVAQGTAAEGYVKKTCNYIQRTAEGYNFTCLIQGIADADHTDVVNCIAYVCFNGEYIFFDAPATADYNALYTTYHK